MKLAAVQINFDTLAEMYGFPAGYRDPCFFEVADRFFEFSARHGFSYTIYVIGRDLENPENRARVREWAGQGHEIGNHSWSHPVNLGAMDEPSLRGEVRRAHELIAETTGRAPRGFIAPGWSTSKALVGALMDLGYTYDASVFPSWLMLLSLGKMLSSHIGHERFSKILSRRDYAYPWLAPTQPYWCAGDPMRPAPPGEKGLMIMPLPCGTGRTACWHTTRFVFGKKAHEALLRSALARNDAFYYLMHPGDLLEAADITLQRRVRMERLKPGLAEKTAMMEECLQLIRADGRRWVTMEQLAEEALKQVDGSGRFERVPAKC